MCSLRLCCSHYPEHPRGYFSTPAPLPADEATGEVVEARPSCYEAVPGGVEEARCARVSRLGVGVSLTLALISVCMQARVGRLRDATRHSF